MAYQLIPQYILIIASSARMAAQAIRKIGLKPLVIDLFADIDTQHDAEAFYRTPSLAVADLVPAVDFFINRYAVAHALYGSGFEYHPESLHYLNSRLVLLGNTPDTFARLQNKAGFFTVLAGLEIPYPDVSFTPPENADNWLVKPMRGQGGAGIKHYCHEDTPGPVYWQQYQQGVSQSVLFLADRQTVRVIGFNTQWTVGLATGEAFIFSGMINDSGLSIEHKALITDWLADLVLVFGLNGLNAMDFIWHGDKFYVLEINPRLSASLQLYDEDILISHIRASQADMIDNRAVQQGYTGYQIVYAARDVVIPDAFDWPEGCMDLPSAGVNCRKGMPICSIIFRAKASSPIFEQLQHKQRQLLNQLQTGSPL